MCKLEMASILGSIQVEMSNASMCTATSMVVQIANEYKRGFGSCSPPGLLLFNCICLFIISFPREVGVHWMEHIQPAAHCAF